ncbi:putative glutamine amidotransferase [Lentibacillus halodurans]|uniref:Putative glutamine amidotransferase n=1 Tax=Lentibacillus halodurans TaxID=237679 RepID=A0A1I0W5M6_9BACI|nr:gamma-glutamyl-gamma-aminobutyrate hydrolase family protein [Lentibacillus halodurans]SFA83874.1 putative glutamine amidotransferase [Lentibacillus halodurans]
MKQPIKPVIGITSSVVNHNNIKSVNLHERFISSVIQAGGIPIVIPNGTNDMPEVWTSICDGLILSSGEDIDPNSFQENPDPKLQKINVNRDEIEMALVHHALKQKKPIFAICRGITLLNVALGGTVIQDIETKAPHAIKHYQLAGRSEATHDIQIEYGSRLYELVNRSEIRVNSMHHQAIDMLASGLKVTAVTPDGMIEAVEAIDESSSLFMGVQWHPEEMASDDPTMQKLFKAFVNECTNSQ